MKTRESLLPAVLAACVGIAGSASAATAPNPPVITSQGMAPDGTKAGQVTWTAPSSDGGSPITGYDARLSDARYGTVLGTLSVSAATFSAKVAIPASQACGQTMYFDVYAKNAVGSTRSNNFNNPATFAWPCPATPTPTPAPTGISAPITLTVSNVKWNGATLSWTANPAATKYTLQESYNGYFQAGTTATLFSGNALTYNDTFEPNGTTRFYQVRAENATTAGPWAAFKTANPVAPPITLATPNLSATKAATGWTANLSWNAIPGAANYEVVYSQNSTFPGTGSTTRSFTTTSTVISLPGNSYWYFRVRAKSATGYSNWSNSGLLNFQ